MIKMKITNKNLLVGTGLLLTYTVGLLLMLYAYQLQIDQRLPYIASGFILFITSFSALCEFFKKRIFNEDGK